MATFAAPSGNDQIHSGTGVHQDLRGSFGYVLSHLDGLGECFLDLVANWGSATYLHEPIPTIDEYIASHHNPEALRGTYSNTKKRQIDEHIRRANEYLLEIQQMVKLGNDIVDDAEYESFVDSNEEKYGRIRKLLHEELKSCNDLIGKNTLTDTLESWAIRAVTAFKAAIVRIIEVTRVG